MLVAPGVDGTKAHLHGYEAVAELKRRPAAIAVGRGRRISTAMKPWPN
ncbi:hypothetical protein FRUB_06439 [Fimbriiglobus ruber]|uniref:Uncharacterized protein n=1 Tax=Fimbriiglobus ruber TaxID=1908690 RepID=A0A225DJG1_9BACT|nr:hypothetical protein FRUB_06439 [Fimbriiglobus ruber]